MKQRYTLEVLRNKAYRKAYTGKQSQCFIRSLQRTDQRVRIRRETDGEVIFQRDAVAAS